MEFYEDSFQFVRPEIHNGGFFAGEKLIDVEKSSQLPPLSPSTIKSVFATEEEQSYVDQLTTTESYSLKKERMLEDGQIKIFTSAIDSYYNSNSDQDPPSLPSPSFNAMFTPTVAFNHPIDLNSTSANSIHLQKVSAPLTTQYSISSENGITGIPEKRASCESHQTNRQKRRIWNPNVGKKILAAYFSPMNIKSEFLSTITMLDGFESFALQEAAFALHEIVRVQQANGEQELKETRANLYADPRPDILVSSCEKCRAFRKLDLHDKIILLKNAFLDLNAMKNVTSYDPTIDGWRYGNKICTRQYIYRNNPILFKKAVNIMDSFPARFKSDYNVIALLFFIVIFNADLPKLKFKNTIKSEQYVFIYLLRRYLISCCESTCEALDYFIHLLNTVEEIQVLKRATEQDFDTGRPDGARWLTSQVVRHIEIKSIPDSI